MARSSPHHHVLTNGVGKCSVPMWCNGVPADFCDEPAYGPQEKDQTRYGQWGNWWTGMRPGFNAGYCPGLACFNHGGPKAPVTEPQEIKP